MAELSVGAMALPLYTISPVRGLLYTSRPRSTIDNKLRLVLEVSVSSTSETAACSLEVKYRRLVELCGGIVHVSYGTQVVTAVSDVYHSANVCDDIKNYSLSLPRSCSPHSFSPACPVSPLLLMLSRCSASNPPPGCTTGAA